MADIDDYDRVVDIDDNGDFFKGGETGFRFIPLFDLSKQIGVHVLVLRYMIALLAGYPFAMIWLLFPKGRGSKKFNHTYFTCCGLLMAYFCFGSDCVYNLISILASYASLTLLGPGLYNVVFTFVFQMTYMLGAYVVYSSDGYDIKWTTPQCMLCLKLIGLAWDLYDGSQKKEKLRPYQLETCYEQTPSLLEMLGFSYFFGSFLAGPLFSFKTYIDFTHDELVDYRVVDPDSRFYVAFKRIVAGIFAMLIFVKFDGKYTPDHLYTYYFQYYPFLTKITVAMLTYHIHFCKYVTIWMFSESICAILGLSYNGIKDGKPKWDSVRNFKYRSCLFGPFFQDMLEGFNINTSRWSGRYVFRRLAFLGNKTVSHVLTLLFLSAWHGFYIGYLILFAIEFCLIMAERKLCANLRILTGKSYEELSFPARAIIRVVGVTYKAYICAFAATSFMLLTWDRIRIAYGYVHYWGIWVIVIESVVVGITSIMVQRKIRVEKEKES